MGQPEPPNLEIPPELIAAQDAIQWQLLALPGVTGVGIGYLEENGELIDEVALRVMLGDLAQVPEGVPETLAGFRVCFVEGGVEPCAPPDGARYAEIAGGIKIGTGQGSGTLGIVVKDAADKSSLGLTCFHVIGDPVSAPGSVWQPDAPPFIVGQPLPREDMLGDTLRFEFPRTAPLPFARERVSNVDAAVFALDTGIAGGRSVSPRIVAHAGGAASLVTRPTSTARVELGTPVVKRGFVTGVTRGFVIDARATIRWTPGGQDTYLVEQYGIESGSDNPGTRFCETGDSGAAVIREGTQTIVGLLYGATPGRQRAYASYIQNVEAQLGITAVWP